MYQLTVVGVYQTRNLHYMSHRSKIVYEVESFEKQVLDEYGRHYCHSTQHIELESQTNLKTS